MDMRTIGLIGGVSWHSTLEYYRVINQTVSRALGGAASAKLVLVSLNFAEVLRAGKDENSSEHARIYRVAGEALRNAGAEFIVICSNTGHRRADDIEQATGLEVLHVADVTAQAVKSAGFRRVALLGTAATMQSPFIRKRIEDRWCIEVAVPDAETRSTLDRMIMTEMAGGIFSDEARRFVCDVIDRMRGDSGVEASILGCTELPLLLANADIHHAVFDTLRLHAEAAAQRALAH